MFIRSITGIPSTKTQKKIVDTLHMDYDTFVNSAYLRQGHADEFTRQPPGKRKEVLGTILGLETYDVLEDKAKLKARQQENECLQIETAVKEMAAELEHRTEYEVEFAQAQAPRRGGQRRTMKEQPAELVAPGRHWNSKKPNLPRLVRQMKANASHGGLERQTGGKHNESRSPVLGGSLDGKTEIETGYQISSKLKRLR